MSMDRRLKWLEEAIERNQPDRPRIPTLLLVQPKSYDKPVTDEDIERKCQEYLAKYGCRPKVVLVVQYDGNERQAGDFPFSGTEKYD